MLRYSPTLADKMAVSTEEGLDRVVGEVLEAINKDKLLKNQRLEDKPPISLPKGNHGNADQRETAVSPTLKVAVDGFTLQDPALTKVYSRGMGYPGFEFEGVAPGDRGKEIVEMLKQLEKKDIVTCMASDGLRKYSGYGRFQFNYEVDSTKPVWYRFHGIVSHIQ